MEKQKNKIATTVVLMLVVACVFISGSIVKTPVASDLLSEGLRYNSMVCVAKNDEKASCGHNTITDVGKNMIRNALTNGSTGFPINITVSNKTVPVAATTALEGYDAVCFLDTAMCGTNGTISSNGVGTWTITKTFTAGQINSYNTTGLYGPQFGVGGALFAGNTFTSVSLQANDQLTINWTIYVT